jgi:acyl-CoA synthetase (AMP-forming)/AMP-acid ligase II
MIISGGENVYSTEVEAALYAHPAILEAAVIGIPDEQWGEAVHACVVLKPEQSLTSDELRDFCKTLIAGYKCPRSVSFLAELPKSGPGKILKKDLREPYWAGKDRGVS